MIVAVSVLALQASGLSSWFLPPACAERCEDDSDGTCPPTCSCCTCCIHPRSFARMDAPRSAAIPDLGRLLAVDDSDKRPEAPPAREILHVPKRLGCARQA